MNSVDERQRWRAWATRCESTLERAIAERGELAPRLTEAMRYSVLGGGKRLRPLLVYATGTAFGADENALDFPAAALETVHAYSLVHDDLPAMDDDVLRRGRPTVHVAFDEATAILAGDGLQTLAFELLGEAPVPADSRIAMIRELAKAAGMQGMVGGQAIDLASVGKKLSLEALKQMHGAKTGALIRASVALGALAAGCDGAVRHTLDEYAKALGLAFQIRDDLLDIEGDAAQIGKTPGKDAANDKPTYPALIGIDESRRLLEALSIAMQSSLQALGLRDDCDLAALARFAVQRAH